MWDRLKRIWAELSLESLDCIGQGFYRMIFFCIIVLFIFKCVQDNPRARSPFLKTNVFFLVNKKKLFLNSHCISVKLVVSGIIGKMDVAKARQIIPGTCVLVISATAARLLFLENNYDKSSTEDCGIRYGKLLSSDLIEFWWKLRKVRCHVVQRAQKQNQMDTTVRYEETKGLCKREYLFVADHLNYCKDMYNFLLWFFIISCQWRAVRRI